MPSTINFTGLSIAYFHICPCKVYKCTKSCPRIIKYDTADSIIRVRRSATVQAPPYAGCVLHTTALLRPRGDGGPSSFSIPASPEPGDPSKLYMEHICKAGCHLACRSTPPIHRSERVTNVNTYDYKNRSVTERTKHVRASFALTRSTVSPFHAALPTVYALPLAPYSGVAH